MTEEKKQRSHRRVGMSHYADSRMSRRTERVRQAARRPRRGFYLTVVHERFGCVLGRGIVRNEQLSKPMKTLRFPTLVGFLLLSATASPAKTPVPTDRPVDRPVGTLVEVAEFEQQLVGVAASASGRVFISFPRNGIDDVKKSVAEVIDGKAVPYPNEEYNALNTAEPATHFLSAQSVYVDSSDTLWVLDTGNLGSGTALIEGGPKLVAINLTTNAVTRTIAFPDSLLGTGTSLNDVRFDLARGTAGFAYLSDSSAMQGSGIIVVDLSTGQAVRRLANDPSVLPDPSFRAVVEGRPFVTQAKATDAPSLLTIACDGIAVSADGKLVYYCPIASRYLYSVSADALTDFTQSDAAVAATVKNVGDKGEVGGLEADAQGRVYLTTGEYNAVRRFDPAAGTADTFNASFETLVHDRHLVWPDSLALGKDGSLYITSTQVNRLPSFNAGVVERQPPYILYKVQTDGTPGTR